MQCSMACRLSALIATVTDAGMRHILTPASALRLGLHARPQAVLLQQACSLAAVSLMLGCSRTGSQKQATAAHLAQPDEQVKDVGVVVEQSACSAGCTVSGMQLQQSGMASTMSLMCGYSTHTGCSQWLGQTSAQAGVQRARQGQTRHDYRGHREGQGRLTSRNSRW